MVQPAHVRSAALVALGVDPRLQLGRAERHHPTLAGRKLLVGVEAEHGQISPAPHRRAVAVTAPSASQASSTIPKPTPSGDRLESVHVGGIAEDMHRQKRPRTLGYGRLRGLGIEVKGDRVDVGEHRPSPLVQSHVGGRHERERACDHLVALGHPDRPQGEMKPGRAARHRGGKRARRTLGEHALE